jgi:ABC-2 type transport system ATP-binding protein
MTWLDDDTPALRSSGLGKRYGHKWALEDCSFSVPRGRVTALVGPNGAGKTTLLRLLVGLTSPSAGEAEVLGRRPAQREDFLSSVGYLAQDVPLYSRLTAEEHLGIGAHLNHRWDGPGARERLERLRIPMNRAVAKLSGGQRAQVGLGLALAKRPQMLLLDEPVAALDPLARREFLSSLTEAVAESDLSVILSSHLLHDLERVCDHVILLSESHTQLCDDIENVLVSHRMLVGPRRSVSDIERSIHVIKATHTSNQSRLVVRLDGPVLDPSWAISEVGLEDVILAYMSQEASVPENHLSVMGGAA